MFNSLIVHTQLTGADADSVLGSIYGDGFYIRDISEYDESLISTLRALLHSKTDNNTPLAVSCSSRDYTSHTVRNHNYTQILNAACGSRNGLRDNTLYVMNFNSYDYEDNEAQMKCVKDYFIEYFGDKWHRLEKVTAFFANKIDVLCYINPEIKSTYLFVSNPSISLWHYIQCSIPAILPWFFEGDNKLTKEEMGLIKSFEESTPDKYFEFINKIAGKFDFKSMKIKRLLKGFEAESVRQNRDRKQRDLTSYIREIESLNSRIRDYLQVKSNVEIELIGYDMKIAELEDSSELMDYFLCNKKLVLRDAGSGTVRFTVKDYLTYFDEDIASAMIDNYRSYVNSDYNSDISAEDMRLLMKKIFLEQKLKVRFCATYELRVGEGIYAVRMANYDEPEFEGFTPNPHIDRWQCMGNYEVLINEMISDHNYIAAIEQCIASCKSLNFADSTVLRHFMSTMYCRSLDRYNTRCIELPNGEVVDPTDAIKWIKESTETSTEEENGDE